MGEIARKRCTLANPLGKAYLGLQLPVQAFINVKRIISVILGVRLETPIGLDIEGRRKGMVVDAIDRPSGALILGRHGSVKACFPGIVAGEVAVEYIPFPEVYPTV